MKYVKYLRYLLRHKFFVAKECFRHGLYWRGLVHDISKLTPSEIIPYANFFYGKNGKAMEIRKQRKATGYYKATNSGDSDFDFAWLLHQKRNRHHWQWWTLPEDDGGLKTLPMDWNSTIEMVCDWVGAGKAQGYVSPKNDVYLETRKWYEVNKDKMKLHPDTRLRVEGIIGYTHNPKSLKTSKDGK